MTDLYELIRNDMEWLATEITSRLSNPQSLDKASMLLNAPKKVADVDYLRHYDSSQMKDLASLAIGSDCLQVIGGTYSADAEHKAEDATNSFTLVAHIAAVFATSDLRKRNKYRRYIDLKPEDVISFFTVFRNDPGRYGGAKCELLGQEMALIASGADGDAKPIDAYERIIDTLFAHRVGAIRGNEQNLLNSMHGLHDSYVHLLESTVARGRFNSTAAEQAGSEPKPALETSPENALAEAMPQLDTMIGIPSVKTEVKRLISFLKIREERRKFNLPISTQSLHYVFTGNPGTGKTTVARILAKVFYGFGILKSMNLVECDRSSLVAGYVVKWTPFFGPRG